VRWQGLSQSTQEKEIVKEYTNTDIAKIIDEYIHSERDRAILKRRFCDGVCYEPLAEEFDMSVAQVKRIVYKNEIKIFNHI
jgi:hypothetical protein